MDTRLLRKIDANRRLVQNDGLILPSERDLELAELTLSYIFSYKRSELSSLPDSTYEVEMDKVFEHLHLFSDYEVLNKSKIVLNKVTIARVMPKGMYSSTFKLQGQLPWDLNIPVKLDGLSHVYIGHELIHLLKETNSKEWVNLLSYSEVLPILYEFIQTRYKRVNDRQRIIDYRISQLRSMNQKLEESMNLPYFINNPEDLSYYMLPEYGYFISFYYATRLYKIYLSHPKEVLQQFKRVLLHEITTKELLEHCGIYDDWDLFEFGKSYEKLLSRQTKI